MAKVRASLGGSGGSSNVVIAGPTTQASASITLGFKPKYLMVVFRYTSNQVMGCYYNEDESTTSYKRIYQATTDTQTFPSNNAGIKTIDSDGFTMNSGNLTNFSYIAVG